MTATLRRLGLALVLLAGLAAWGTGVARKAFDYDEVEHAHAAWLVAQGDTPYHDFFECHPPFAWYGMAAVDGLLPAGPGPRGPEGACTGSLSRPYYLPGVTFPGPHPPAEVRWNPDETYPGIPPGTRPDSYPDYGKFCKSDACCAPPLACLTTMGPQGAPPPKGKGPVWTWRPPITTPGRATASPATRRRAARPSRRSTATKGTPARAAGGRSTAAPAGSPWSATRRRGCAWPARSGASGARARAPDPFFPRTETADADVDVDEEGPESGVGVRHRPAGFHYPPRLGEG